METGKTDDIFSHFGISVEAMKQQVKQGEVEKIDFRVCEKKNAKEATANMSGFGMEESQRIIIDYDKECDLVLVRREVRKYGASFDAPSALQSKEIRDSHIQQENQATSLEQDLQESQRQCRKSKISDTVRIHLCEDEESALRLSQERIQPLEGSS